MDLHLGRIVSKAHSGTAALEPALLLKLFTNRTPRRALQAVSLLLVFCVHASSTPWVLAG